MSVDLIQICFAAHYRLHLTAFGIEHWRHELHRLAQLNRDEERKMKFLSNWQLRPLVGLILGAIIVYTDNFAFQAEVSPLE